MRPVLALLLVALPVALLEPNCALGAEQRVPDPIHVFAAASLSEAADELARAYEGATGKRVIVTFAASSTLARQIAAGAPADLFLSAHEDWAQWLEDKGYLRREGRIDFAGNGLVVIQPPGKQETNLPPLDALVAVLPGRIAVGDPEHVPVGRYARQVLERNGVWETIAPYLLPTENTLMALRLVEKDLVAAGIVYSSDAQSGDVSVVGLLPDPDRPIRYVAGLVEGRKGEPDEEDAAGFLRFLTSPAAVAILCERGFSMAVFKGKGGSPC